MAQRMEKKSARILAFVLALIMLGSVFAYMLKGQRTVHEREIDLRLDNFREYVKYIPEGAIFFEYVNISYLNLPQGDPLRQTVDKMVKDLLVREIFSRTILDIPYGFKQMLAAYYGTMPLYFVDTNGRKIYFAAEDEIHVGKYTIAVRPGVAVFDRMSPFVVGNPSLVRAVVQVLEGNRTSVENETYPYLSRINGTFLYAWFTIGKGAGKILKANNTTISDFFFEGWGYNEKNGTYYKVWGVHFLGNYFFSKRHNESVEYVKIKNYKDQFSVARLEDPSFGKVLKAQPRILTYKISFKPVNSTNETKT